MRHEISTCLLALTPAAAGAHALPADQGLANQLGHQFFSAHHLAMVVTAIGVGVLLKYLADKRVRSRDAKGKYSHKK